MTKKQWKTYTNKEWLLAADIGIQCWLQILNKEGLFNLTMVVSLARRQNVKMVPFDVVTGVFNVISNSRRVIIFQKGLEMFRFPVVESSLRFPNVKIIAVPAASL